MLQLFEALCMLNFLPDTTLYLLLGCVDPTKNTLSTKVYDVVTEGLFSNPRHQNHRTC